MLAWTMFFLAVEGAALRLAALRAQAIRLRIEGRPDLRARGDLRH